VTTPLGLLEQVWAGEARLTGEVIALEHDQATIQIYEETSGLRPGEPLFASGRPLSVMLGPGLIGQTFDGIQRPLAVIRDQHSLDTFSGIFIKRGSEAEALPSRRWHWRPEATIGSVVTAGAVLGVIPETPLVTHRLLVPSNLAGTPETLAAEGEYGLEEAIAVIRDAAGERHQVTMVRHWPVRLARPIRERLEPTEPLLTGQRVLDTFLPLAKGGAAALPGPFGAGKTVLQHTLAKWSDADVIVYVGCGERGNEMAQVLKEFPELIDPRSGHPLMERTILIANTSNMPVAAREASIYTGITLAEYYRDQGYHVALMADSTSRWAEALREIAGRLEEMPAEEGYPAYLPSRLAAFYERSGRVRTLATGEGSVTIIGAVSPPGGDFTEPVTQHTQRFTRALWALDRALASARHYPAINWQTGYSFYLQAVTSWWRSEVSEDWAALRSQAAELLEEDTRLEQLVRLVGSEALPDRQRWVLEAARLVKEGYLQQSALHPVDAYCNPAKQVKLLRLFVTIYQLGRELIASGVTLVAIHQVLDIPGLVRLKETVANDRLQQLDDILTSLSDRLQALRPPVNR